MKRRVKKWSIISIILIVLFFLSHTIVSHFISKAIEFQIEKINEKKQVSLKVDQIQLSVLTSKLTLKGVHFKPVDSVFNEFKQGKLFKPTIGAFSLSELKIKGFSILRILFSKEIITHTIAVDGLDLTIYKSETYTKTNSKTKKLVLDSIFIKGISAINLGDIKVNHFNFKLLNAKTSDTLFQYKETKLEISGVGLKPYANTENYFKFDKEHLKINLKKQEIDLEDSNYTILFDEVDYNFEEKTIQILNFKLNPKHKKSIIAASYKYNNEVFDVAVKNINVSGFKLDSILQTNIVKVDSIMVDGLVLEIYKDQTKPFNLAKRPLFLNQKLKQLKQPLNIEKVQVKNGSFLYEEKLEGKQDLMTISISDLNTSIEKITTIKDSLTTKKELTIQVKGTINKVAPLNLDIQMPYNSYNDSFSFSGEVGSADFSSFNSAIYPALGAKTETGKLHNVQFKVFGNPQGTKGTMTMLYSNVTANFFKTNEKHKGEINKTISWLTNSIIISENPSSKGKLKVALIEAERTPYKGFGNLVWKSFMSGMMNTMLPTGKKLKESQFQKDQRKEANKAKRIETRKLKNQ